MKYLITKCRELNDQYECDVDRELICITDNYDDFNKYGYEVYKIYPNGSLVLIKEYYEAGQEFICIEHYSFKKKCIIKREKILNGNRDSVTMENIKEWKNKYHIKEYSIAEMYNLMQAQGNFSFDVKNGVCAIRECQDEEIF